MSQYLFQLSRFVGVTVTAIAVFGMAARVEGGGAPATAASGPMVLKVDSFKHYVDHFNSMEDEFVVNLIPNEKSWAWMADNVPAFECPDKDLEEIYWYRWWVYRKALIQMPDHLAMTEFINRSPVSSAVGHHIMESRWVRDRKYGEEIIRYWLGREKGPAQDTLHYSGWTIWAAYQQYLVSYDRQFIVSMVPDFINYYQAWELSRMNPDGSFWQNDSRDAMEESISGSRTEHNLRPTINSYMYGNAAALAEIAKLAGRADVVATYSKKAATLRRVVQDRLWNPQAHFFEVRWIDDGDTNNTLCGTREEIGFIPWYFNLPEKNKGYEQAWEQLLDPNGFKAPFGITTAEMRSPRFRFNRKGKCEWNGPVWPFATSQTLTALANVLNNYDQSVVTAKDFLEGIQTYARSMHQDGKPNIGEYLDEQTGELLHEGDLERGRYYNHSTFCDLIINDLVGLRPRPDNVIEINPLIPADTWDYFCLDGVSYHGRIITVVWDRTGEKYGKGKGLTVLCDGQAVARSPQLAHLTGSLP